MMSLHCTEYSPLYWWYPSTVLNVLNILHCTDDIPPLYWISFTVLRTTLHRTDNTPSPYWWYTSIVLNILHGTDDIPPPYWISSAVLHTLHYTVHTLPEVIDTITIYAGPTTNRKLGALAKWSNIVVQTFLICLSNNAWTFDHVTKHSNKHSSLQVLFVKVSNFKCSTNNVWSFGKAYTYLSLR